MQKLRTNNGQDHKFVLQLPTVLHFLNHISAAKITSDYLGDHISSQLPSSPPPSERDPSLSSCCHSKCRYILGASPDSYQYLSTTLRKFLSTTIRKAKPCVSYGLPTSSTGVLTAMEQAAAVLATATARNQRPRMSESIRDVSRLLPAPFSSNPCFVLPTL